MPLINARMRLADVSNLESYIPRHFQMNNHTPLLSRNRKTDDPLHVLGISLENCVLVNRQLFPILKPNLRASERDRHLLRANICAIVVPFPTGFWRGCSEETSYMWDQISIRNTLGPISGPVLPKPFKVSHLSIRLITSSRLVIGNEPEWQC